MAEEEQQSQMYSEQEVSDLIRTYTESKETAHSFFTKVIFSETLTPISKTGNLNQEELGISRLPVRTYEELGLFCNDICNRPKWGEYFDKLAKIQLITSLGKDGFLIRQAGTKRSEIADVTPKQRVNRGFFKKKNEQPVSAY